VSEQFLNSTLAKYYQYRPIQGNTLSTVKLQKEFTLFTMGFEPAIQLNELNE